jgi:hypothetical protein
MLLTIEANSAQQNASRKTICAEREMLLATLIEAHGEIPNSASAKLAAASMDIMQARTACDEGRADDAVALYDRLIAQIGLVVMGSQDRYRYLSAIDVPRETCRP